MNTYLYNGYVTDVYDGDTITCDIDLGFYTTLKKQKIRLYGINTPEVRGTSREEGLKVRDIVRGMILNKEIILETKKDKKGKYGRWLATIYIIDEHKSASDNNSNTEYININQWLIENNYAKLY